MDLPHRDLECLLRHAYHLSQLAPRSLRRELRPEVCEARFELLLDCEAFESAAIGLVGSPMSFDVVKSETGLVEARAWLPNQVASPPVRSSNVAMALLGAWARCAIALETRSLTPHTENPRPAPHKARPGLHLRLIEH